MLSFKLGLPKEVSERWDSIAAKQTKQERRSVMTKSSIEFMIRDSVVFSNSPSEYWEMRMEDSTIIYGDPMATCFGVSNYFLVSNPLVFPNRHPA